MKDKNIVDGEIAGSAATGITRFERILRSLKEKRAHVSVVNPSNSDALHIFFLQASVNTTKKYAGKKSVEFHSLKFVMPNSNNVMQLTFDPRFCDKRLANFD